MCEHVPSGAPESPASASGASDLHRLFQGVDLVKPNDGGHQGRTIGSDSDEKAVEGKKSDEKTRKTQKQRTPPPPPVRFSGRPATELLAKAAKKWPPSVLQISMMVFAAVSVTQSLKSLSHSLTRSLTHSLIHSRTHAPTHPPTRLGEEGGPATGGWSKEKEDKRLRAAAERVQQPFLSAVRLAGGGQWGGGRTQLRQVCEPAPPGAPEGPASSPGASILSHSLTHSLTHARTRSLAHARTHARTDSSLAHSLTHSLDGPASSGAAGLQHGGGRSSRCV
jgi:hypothetical protein